MAVAAGRGRPLGEPQMVPSVSYLAKACDLSYIHIYRLTLPLRAASTGKRVEGGTASLI